MQYTTLFKKMTPAAKLFYLDFKDTFVCNTQRFVGELTMAVRCFIWISKILLGAIHNTALADGMECEVVLSGFQ